MIQKEEDREPSPVLKKLVIFVLIYALIAGNVKAMLDTAPGSKPRTEGIPNISYTYSALEYCSIDQIVETDSEIYILYGENKGNVQVFDQNGNYKYSLYFKKHLNGVFRIAAHDTTLYVRDDAYNVYVFLNGAFQKFYRRENAIDILDSIDFNNHASDYAVRFGSVWRVDENEQTCIIKRPLLSMLYQNNLMFYISLFFASAVGFVFRKKK